MEKVARKGAEKEVPMLRLLGEVVRQELREFVVTAGMTALAAMLEGERTDAAGRDMCTRSSGALVEQDTRRASW